MFYNLTEVHYIWLVYSNSGYIHHYGPNSLLLCCDDIENTCRSIWKTLCCDDIGNRSTWKTLSNTVIKISGTRIEYSNFYGYICMTYYWAKLYPQLWLCSIETIEESMVKHTFSMSGALQVQNFGQNIAPQISKPTSTYSWHSMSRYMTKTQVSGERLSSYLSHDRALNCGIKIEIFILLRPIKAHYLEEYRRPVFKQILPL